MYVQITRCIRSVAIKQFFGFQSKISVCSPLLAFSSFDDNTPKVHCPNVMQGDQIGGNFRLLGNCLIWAVFFNYRSSPNIWITFVST
jgi:hypothetical protein